LGTTVGINRDRKVNIELYEQFETKQRAHIMGWKFISWTYC